MTGSFHIFPNSSFTSIWYHNTCSWETINKQWNMFRCYNDLLWYCYSASFVSVISRSPLQQCWSVRTFCWQGEGCQSIWWGHGCGQWWRASCYCQLAFAAVTRLLWWKMFPSSWGAERGCQEQTKEIHYSLPGVKFFLYLCVSHVTCGYCLVNIHHSLQGNWDSSFAIMTRL